MSADDSLSEIGLVESLSRTATHFAIDKLCWVCDKSLEIAGENNSPLHDAIYQWETGLEACHTLVDSPEGRYISLFFFTAFIFYSGFKFFLYGYLLQKGLENLRSLVQERTVAINFQTLFLKDNDV